MAVKTKEVKVNGWAIITNEDSNVLVSDTGIVGVTSPTDITDVIVIILKDNEVELGRMFYGAKVKVSTNKEVTILFDEE
ncbi:hypothetical protein [Lactobacillus sp. UCMA15818]|uniref:hypothetical protein n=1 Tax=Lactobacillaceae TaxID=33958 RepID=UPI0025B21960|nr:hypothetical protein [Lactobacillus sp. UCMA15818]MDN2453181.1 hypothetical protein [Lactobacillus sp. UCMA15818]